MCKKMEKTLRHGKGQWREHLLSRKSGIGRGGQKLRTRWDRSGIGNSFCGGRMINLITYKSVEDTDTVKSKMLGLNHP